MTDEDSWEGLHYCELEGCEEVAVVEISLEHKTDNLNEDICREPVLCRGHADFLIEKVESNEQFDYRDKSLRSAKGQKIDLIRRELIRDEASIRIPDGTDPLDIIDPDKTKEEIIQACSSGGQYKLELCESEKHAKRVSANDDPMPNCEVLSIAFHTDCEPWRGVNVVLSYSVGIDVSQDYQDIIDN